MGIRYQTDKLVGCVGVTKTVTSSSRFLLITLLGSLGPIKENSFQPNPEAKRDYANVQLSVRVRSSQGGYHSKLDKETTLRIRVCCCYLGYRGRTVLLNTRDCVITEKSSGRPDSGAARNSLRSGRFGACQVSSRQLQIFERWDLQLNERTSRTPKRTS
ncbi:hypothetical protein TNCV_1258551 [Trichonephila clavipes]|nr:hypothetical protein TNCV_1258551 [Trichonephila clavipes]